MLRIFRSMVNYEQIKRNFNFHNYVEILNESFRFFKSSSSLVTENKNFNWNEFICKDSSHIKTVDKLYHGLYNGERAALAESITLVESLNESKKQMGQHLLQLVLQNLKHPSAQTSFTGYIQNKLNKTNEKTNLTLRLGITGPPGAGKSTFIEQFGLFLTRQMGFKVAVLAIDPSSKRTGGSLLGDKTRMLKLSSEPMAYVRPSPSKGELGGVACNTMEALLLCEGSGYDIVIVETVGVGQSEVAVSDMTDLFVLVIPPAGGDELQGLKRGIIENCDFVLVNKADGDLVPAARRIQTEYTSALKFIPRKYKNWRPRVRRISSLSAAGIEDLWLLMVELYEYLLLSGILVENRKNQQNAWMWNHIRSNILLKFQRDPDVKLNLIQLKDMVENNQITPGLASDKLLNIFFSQINKK